MADISIDSTIDGTDTPNSVRSVVFTTLNIGYWFYIDSNGNFVYRKTTDGGGAWGATVVINTTTFCLGFDVWWDQNTPGDSGTLIHLWYFDAIADDVFYRSFNTSGDTFGTEVVVFAGVSASLVRGIFVSGTKTRDGKLYVAYDIDAGSEKGFHRSVDAGVTWPSLSAGFVEAAGDECFLFPASNTGDDADCWTIYHDDDANALTLKMWDSSAVAAVESATILTLTSNTTQGTGEHGFSASVRHSDGHLILAAISEYDTATADHRTFDINGTGSVTELTAITTNIDDHYHPQVFINQNTDDIYVAYNGKRDGTETLGTSTKVYYTKSTDGGTTWTAGDTTYQEGAAGIVRQVWVPQMGPRFYAGWRVGSTLVGNKVSSIDTSNVNATSQVSGNGDVAAVGAKAALASSSVSGDGELTSTFTSVQTAADSATELSGDGAINSTATKEALAVSAISGDGLIVTVGAEGVLSEGITISGDGELSSSFLAIDNFGQEAVTLSGDGAVTGTGAKGAFGSVTVDGDGLQEVRAQEGTVELALVLSMVPEAEAVELDLILDMLEYGTASTSIELLMYDPSFVESNPLCWSVKVTLDAVDVSTNLIGTVRVDAEESLARTATFTLKHTGTIEVPDWVGKPVTIDFQQIDPDNIPLVTVRVFTGIVDVPQFDPTRVLVQFDCLDNLNGVIGQNPRGALDQLIGGWWSPFVFDPDANSLEYAQAQLLSVPKALDMDAYAQLRVTDWAAKATPDFVLDATTHVLDDSVSFEMPNRSELKNCVNIEFQYRFPRLRARRTGVAWQMPSLFSLINSIVDFTIPTKQMTEGAVQGLSGGGWFITGISYVEPPVNQTVSTMSGDVEWICFPGVAAALAWGVSVALARKWTQAVTEIYPMKVVAASSVTGVGEICEDETVGMEVGANVFDFAGWEADLTRQPSPFFGGSIHTGSPPWPRALQGDSGSWDTTSYGQDFVYDMVDVPGFARSDQDYAVQTILNVAKTRILGSHRNSRITCVAPLNPFLDLIHTVEIDTPKLAGKGKAAAVTYEMDIDSGKATMVVSVAISGTGFVGFQPTTALSAPPVPPQPTYTPPIAQSGQTFFGSDTASVFPQPDVATCKDGYLGNRVNQDTGFDADKRYVEEFRLQAPAIEDELTQPLELEQTLVEYDVVIPQDPLILTG
jgi:hypothetical protein